MSYPTVFLVDDDAAIRDALSLLISLKGEVLSLLADGLQHRDIAERLQISPRTVEVYKARMMEKLHAHSLAEVIRLGTAAAGKGRQREWHGNGIRPAMVDALLLGHAHTVP